MLTDPEFWTVPEIAALLRTSKMTVYRLIHTGQLDARRFCRTFRVPDAVLTAYLATTHTTPAQPDTTTTANGQPTSPTQP